MMRSKLDAPRSLSPDPVESRRAETLLALRPLHDHGGPRIGWAVLRGVGAAAALIVIGLVLVAISSARAGLF